jgi:hypothetical protein
MTIPLDASGLNFRAGPGSGRACGPGRAGLKMLRYRDGAEGVREGVGVPGRRGGRRRLLENARRWRGRIERRRHPTASMAWCGGCGVPGRGGAP